MNVDYALRVNRGGTIKKKSVRFDGKISVRLGVQNIFCQTEDNSKSGLCHRSFNVGNERNVGKRPVSG